MHRWRRADAAVAGLRRVIGEWRGEGYAAKDVRWYHRGASGQRSTERVSLVLSVAEAEELIRLLTEEIRTASR